MTFQLHLWAGLLLAMYCAVMGVTGSILVFRKELEQLGAGEKQRLRQSGDAGRELAAAIGRVQARYPQVQIVGATVASPEEPWVVVTVQTPRGRTRLRIDDRDGSMRAIQAKRSWLSVVSALHTTLLAGRTGRMVNGLGGALLLVLTLSGIAIWWPGTRLWKRGLVVDVRRRWRRIFFDLHRALGIWSAAALCCWSISAIYFGWPEEVFAAVNRISAIRNARPPDVVVRPPTEMRPPDMGRMIEAAAKREPEAVLAGVNFPYSRRAPFEVLLTRSGGVGREYTDTLYFSPWDGSYLQTWRYGVNESLGDWLIWLQVPLHFGTFWGLGFQIFWAALGLSLPLLATTGAVLYWNRFLRHKF